MGTYIFTESYFKVKMKAYLSLQDTQGAQQVGVPDDFPQDAEIQKKLVRELIIAVQNMDCLDATSKTPVKRIKKLSPF